MLSKMFQMLVTPTCKAGDLNISPGRYSSSCWQKRNTGSKQFYLCLITCCLLSFLMISGNSVAAPKPETYYFQIEHNIPYDDNDLDVTSVGLLSFKNNSVGYANLNYVDSEINGSAATVDLAGGFAYTGDISLYVSVGISLGYNWDIEDYITAYYPEVGVLADFTKTFGMKLTAKRYFNIYDTNEDVVMLGLVFRK